jgi:uncharacterized membrane protein YdbT with pleckstrin-like domain
MPVTKFTSKKHWSAYVIPVAVLLSGLFLCTRSSYLPYIGFGLVLVALRKIIILFTVRWEISDRSLSINKGILPWQKLDMEIPIFNIYESYVTFGMFGHLLGYANIAIRRTEGITTKISETSLTGAKVLSEHINSLIQEHMKQKGTGDYRPDNNSLAQELQRLAQLKNSGELTVGEYEKLKQKLIDKS